jgi:hypothetical protein
VCSHTELISLEQLTGAINPDSEATLSLYFSNPPNSVYLYSLGGCSVSACPTGTIPFGFPAIEIASRILPSTTTYTAAELANQIQADTGSPLILTGQTAPLASINLFMTAGVVVHQPIPAAPPPPAADSAGNFTFAPYATTVTNTLVEGYNSFDAQAVKSTYTSPWAHFTEIYDVNPPQVYSSTPTGSVNNMAPCIQASIEDLGISTTIVSGIDPNVAKIYLTGPGVPGTVVSQYTPIKLASGTVTALDTATAYPILQNLQTYTVIAEFGDYAGYRSSATWQFTTNVQTTAPTPLVDQPTYIPVSPGIGSTTANGRPVIKATLIPDPLYGLDPSTIQLLDNGTPIVNSSNITATQNGVKIYDACTHTLTFQPTTSMTHGSHTIAVQAFNFAVAGSPQPATTPTTWQFTVP